MPKALTTMTPRRAAPARRSAQPCSRAAAGRRGPTNHATLARPPMRPLHYIRQHSLVDTRVMSAYTGLISQWRPRSLMSDAASEFEAIQVVHGALEPLNSEAKTRVLTYVANLLGIDARVMASRPASTTSEADDEGPNRNAGQPKEQTRTFGSFAELYAAAEPKTNGEKALVAGYWLQVCKGEESFTGASVNKELNNLGHKLANVTDSIDSAKNRKPMLMLQTRKSGSSRQARKLYQVSQAGVNRIEEMIGG